MTDQFDQDKVLSYIEQTMSDAERNSFEKEMAENDALRSLVEDLLSDKALLSSLPCEGPSIDLVEEVMQQQERNMLLGEPDQPLSFDVDEPSPIGRINFTKVIGYTALAATLGLSATVVMLTLPWDSNLWDMATESSVLKQELAMLREEGNEVDSFHKDMETSITEHSLAGEMENPVLQMTKIDLKPAPLLASKNAKSANQVPIDKTPGKPTSSLVASGPKPILRAPEKMMAMSCETNPIKPKASKPIPEDQSANKLAKAKTDVAAKTKNTTSQTALLQSDKIPPLADSKETTNVEPTEKALFVIPHEKVVAINIRTDNVFATEQQLMRWAATNSSQVFKTKPVSEDHTPQLASIDASTSYTANKQLELPAMGLSNSTPSTAKSTSTHSTRLSLADRVRSFTKKPIEKNIHSSVTLEETKTPEKSHATGITGQSSLHTQATHTPKLPQNFKQQNMVIELTPSQMDQLVRSLRIRSGQKLEVVKQPLSDNEANVIKEQIDSKDYLNPIWVSEITNKDENEGKKIWTWNTTMMQNLPTVYNRPIIRIEKQGKIHIPITIIKTTE